MTPADYRREYAYIKAERLGIAFGSTPEKDIPPQALEMVIKDVNTHMDRLENESNTI